MYDNSAEEQLVLYSSYEKKNQQHNVIIKVKIEDFNDLRGEMKRKELISEIYRLNKVTRKLNYYMNRYYPDQKLRKLEHFQVKKVYEWMLSDLK